MQTCKPDPTWDKDINLTLRRVRRAKANRPKQAKGTTRRHLGKCLAAQPDNPWGLRNQAMISLGYDLLTRRFEFMALQSSDIEFRGMIRSGSYPPQRVRSVWHGRIAFSSKCSADLINAWLA